MNSKFAYEVLEYIKTYPEEWNQSAYCGSAYCFAGHTVLKAGISDPLAAVALSEVANPYGNTFLIANTAGEILGLTERQSEILFYASNTIEDLEKLIKVFSGEEESCRLSWFPLRVDRVNSKGIFFRLSDPE